MRAALAGPGLDELLRGDRHLPATSVRAKPGSARHCGRVLERAWRRPPPTRALFVGDADVDERARRARRGCRLRPGRPTAVAAAEAVRQAALTDRRRSVRRPPPALVGTGPPRRGARPTARQRPLTKPPGSLGRLEALGVQLAAIAGTGPAAGARARRGGGGVRRRPRRAGRGRDAVAAGGHRPRWWPTSCAGGAAINVLARQAGARVVVVDVGVAADPRRPRPPTLLRPQGPPRHRQPRRRAGHDRRRGRAALDVGAEVAADLVAGGARLPRHRRDGHRQHHAVGRPHRRPHRPPAGRGHRPGHRHRRRHPRPQGRRWSSGALARHAGAVAADPLDRAGRGRRPGDRRPGRVHRRRRGGAACRSWSTASSPAPPCSSPRGLVPGVAGLRASPATARPSPAPPPSSTHLGLEPAARPRPAAGRGSGRLPGAAACWRRRARVLREMATFDGTGVTDK